MRQEFDSPIPHKFKFFIKVFISQIVDNYVYMCIKDTFQHDLYLNKIVVPKTPLYYLNIFFIDFFNFLNHNFKLFCLKYET